MTTQPQFPNPGTQAPARSRRRVADRPAASAADVDSPRPTPSHRRKTCPGHDPGPVSSLPPPTRSHAGRRQLDAEFPGDSGPPRPQEFFGKNSYTRTTPRRPRPGPSSARPSTIPASSAGTQRQPASQGLRATPSIPRPQPHRLVRPAQLTDHPSVPPDAEDSPIRRKNPPQAISGQPVPRGDRLARDSSPLLPQAAAGAHRRPTVTLTPRSPKAREGIADGRRNHRPRG